MYVYPGKNSIVHSWFNYIHVFPSSNFGTFIQYLMTSRRLKPWALSASCTLLERSMAGGRILTADQGGLENPTEILPQTQGTECGDPTHWKKSVGYHPWENWFSFGLKKISLATYLIFGHPFLENEPNGIAWTYSRHLHSFLWRTYSNMCHKYSSFLWECLVEKQTYPTKKNSGLQYGCVWK